MSEEFVSYAQNLEDVMLWRALKHVPAGLYIDVGAYSPFEDSVTRAFYDRGWRGINIDPDLASYEAFLVARPRDVNLNTAVGDQPGEMAMYFVPGTGLSTLVPDEAELRATEGRAVTQGTVQVDTLDSIWRANLPPGQPVHFLKVDVEGFELEVLRGNDWRSNRPWLVVVEATRPNSQEPTHESWEQILLDAGYEYVYWDGLNRFYVAVEHTELKVAFGMPPNVFDGFVRASEAAALDRASRAESELATLQKSSSWRITRPLRVAAYCLRRIRAVNSRRA